MVIDFVGTIGGAHPLVGVGARFRIDGLTAHLTNKQGADLGVWVLAQPPIPHRNGYYLRTVDGVEVYARWCPECNRTLTNPEATGGD